MTESYLKISTNPGRLYKYILCKYDVVGNCGHESNGKFLHINDLNIVLNDNKLVTKEEKPILLYLLIFLIVDIIKKKGITLFLYITTMVMKEILQVILLLIFKLVQQKVKFFLQNMIHMNFLK